MANICDAANTLLDSVVNLFSHFDSNKTINIYEIQDERLLVSLQREQYLYGCKIEGSSNRLTAIQSLEALAADIKLDVDTSQVFLYYVKKGYFQGTYIYSFSKMAIQQLAYDIGTERLSGRDLVLSIFRIFGIGEDVIMSDNRSYYDQNPVVGNEDFFIPWEFEMASGKFGAKIGLAKERLLREGVMFQATEIKSLVDFSPIELFRMDWEGFIGMRVDFSPIAVKARLAKYETVAKLGDRSFAQTLNALRRQPANASVMEEIEDKTIILNTVAYFNTEKTPDISKLSYRFKSKFEENYLTGEEILALTLFEGRDLDFDSIIPTARMENFFGSTHKRPTDKDLTVHWWGTDISGGFINYSLEENTSPHGMYIGKTGSGKSRQAINGLEQILQFDKETGLAERFYDIKVRYVDVGYTGGPLVMKLKKTYGKDVKIYSSKISDLRFSLFNIDVDEKGVDREGIIIMASLVSFALDVRDRTGSGKDILTGGEQSFLKEVVVRMLEENRYSDLYVSELEDEGVYGAILERIYALGFDGHNKMSDLPDEFNHFKKPILDDVLNEVNIWKEKAEYSNLEKEDLSSLAKKLRSLQDFEFLKMHSNIDNTTEQFTHIDFDEIKDQPPEFSIIYWLLVKLWIRIMKEESKAYFAKRQQPPKTYFYVEEAHNFFRLKSFSELFIQNVKEFRKYGGVFLFISQEVDDVSPKVLSQLGTKIFISSPDEKKKLSSVITAAFGEIHKEDMEVLKHIRPWQMYIMFDKGSMGLKFETPRKYDWFYKPAHPSFEYFEEEVDSEIEIV